MLIFLSFIDTKRYAVGQHILVEVLLFGCVVYYYSHSASSCVFLNQPLFKMYYIAFTY